MRITYDTEFLENGSTIELISIGMVREDGKKYYAIVDDLDLMVRISHHTWLRENVFPFLPVYKIDRWGAQWDTNHSDFKYIKTRDQIKAEVRSFISDTTMPELWAWYGAYDHVALCQLFGRMIDLPNGVPMWTNDLRQEVHRLGNPRYPQQQDGHHNALADAEWNMNLMRYLEALDGPVQGSVGWS